MDLSVSPDLDPIYCYAIVALVGAFAATRQIAARLGGIEGIWLVPRTWVLFAMYSAVPVALFWFLDRTGAVNDSSVFAAVLIGIGYERIIAGGSETLRLPGEGSRFWTPFLDYANEVAKVVRERIDRNRRRLDERVIEDIAGSPERYERLREFVMLSSPDAARLEARLQELERSAAPGNEADLRERKTRLLYPALLTERDAYYLMKRKCIISGWLYWMKVRRLDALVPSVATVLLLVAIAVGCVWWVRPDPRELLTTYYVWRLGKPNATSADQYRSRRELLSLMAAPDSARSAVEKLGTLLRQPGLPVERVDLAIQVLLEHQNRILAANRREGREVAVVPQQLVKSLRAANVDVRLRVNDALRFLARNCAHAADADGDWKPTDGDSTVTLEAHVQQWVAFWEQPCSGGPASR